MKNRFLSGVALVSAVAWIVGEAFLEKKELVLVLMLGAGVGLYLGSQP